MVGSFNCYVNLLSGKKCTNLTIANTSSTTEIEGWYETRLTVNCKPGYRLVGMSNSEESYVAECNSTAEWNDTRSCESE